MTERIDPSAGTGTGTGTSTEHDMLDGRVQRTALKVRHSQSLTSLMEQRRDLRGVHALADFVDDSVRWTA